MSILKVFNTQLSEFLDDLITLFPNDIDLKASRVAVNTLKKIKKVAQMGVSYSG